jgi:hypothetical protein
MPRPPRTAPPLEVVAVKLTPELAAHLRQFCYEHRMTVSEVIREGIEWRLSQDGAVPQVSPGDTPSIPAWLDDAIHAKIAAALAAHQSNGYTVIPEVDSARPAGVPVAVTALVVCPQFNTQTRRLGRLCKQGHEWGTTGQSLYSTSKAGYCIACNTAMKRRAREQKRRQHATTTP